MKVCICLLTVIISLLSFNPGKTSKKLVNKNTKVILNLDDYICSEDQWVYVYGFKSWISGNEEAFFDSAFISKGQRQVELNFKIPCATDLQLFFSKNGPVALTFAAEQDSCVVLDISEASPFSNFFCCMEASQGKLNNYIYELAKEHKEFRNRLQIYAKNDRIDSINILSDHYLNRLIDVMNETTESIVVSYCFTFIKNSIPNTKPKEIFPKFAAKFDWNNSLKEIYDHSAILEPSEDAKKARNRYAQLYKEKFRCELLNKNLGERMDLVFEDANGNKVSTSEIKSPYVFVDFWASWCKPCRKEIPNVKQAAAKYKNDVTVYAVSLDSKRETWQKAIEEDSTKEFIQVIGTLRNGQRTRLLKQLDIKTIPANFLLDKERRIVAKDLRGDELMQTLDSLTNQ